MVTPNAEAIDTGAILYMAAVTPDSTAMPVRAFTTFTQNRHDLAAWTRSCGVTSTAIESSGVYWIPAFDILEPHGFKVLLMNALWDDDTARAPPLGDCVSIACQTTDVDIVDRIAPDLPRGPVTFLQAADVIAQQGLPGTSFDTALATGPPNA